MNRLLLVILFSMTPVLAHGATYYVAKTGNNSNSCAQAQSTSTAKLTVAAGLTCLSAGDTIIVKAGTYYERLKVPVSGTAGSRIRITGERDANGKWLTIIDGSEPLTGWTTAPEVGTGVYKATKPTWAGPISGLSNDPCTMTADGKSIWHVNYRYSDGGETSDTGLTAFTALAMSSADGRWEGVDALFANQGSYTYVRFKNGDNPNSKSVRVAPWSYHCADITGIPDFGVFALNGTDYITIQNFELRGATGVVIYGSANGNIIENNSVHDADYSIQLNNGPSNTIVRNNTVYNNMIGNVGSNVPKAWEPGGYNTGGVGSNLYNTNKYLIGGQTSSITWGIASWASTGSQITGNTLYNLPGGILLYQDVDAKISGNTVHNCSSLAIYWEQVDGTTEIYDNLLYDCNGAMRGNNSQNLPATAKLYIYRNRIWQPRDLGYGIHLGAFGAVSVPNQIYVYENTQIGGSAFAYIGQGANQTFPGTLFVNNLLQMSASTWPPYVDFSFTGTICASPRGLAGWDYNWTFGAEAGCAWVNGNNIESGTKIFDDSVLPSDWSLPPGSPASNAGVDIRKTFTIGEKSYSPLPGSSSGDFSIAPNLGAVQGGTGSISPPTSLRVTGSN